MADANKTVSVPTDSPSCISFNNVIEWMIQLDKLKFYEVNDGFILGELMGKC